MFFLSFTNKFEKDLKLIKKRSLKDLGLIHDFLKNELAIKGAAGLPPKFRAHKLSGNYNDSWECHVKGDLLIIWIEIARKNEIILVRAGSHSDIFQRDTITYHQQQRRAKQGAQRFKIKNLNLI